MNHDSTDPPHKAADEANDQSPQPSGDEPVTPIPDEPKDHSAAAPEPVETEPVAVEPVEAEPEPTLEEIEAAHEEANAAVLSDSRKHTRRSFVVAAAGAAAGYGFYRWIDGSARDMEQPIPLRRVFQTNAAIAHTVFDERALAPTYPLRRAEVLRVNGVYGLKQELVPDSWRLQLVGTRDPQQHPRYSQDVTAWEYRYETAKTGEDAGHDTKVAPGSDTAEKMPPKDMVEREKSRQDRTVRMPRGKEEAGESKSTLAPGTSGLLLTMDDILKLPRHELVTQFKCIEGWSQIVHWAGVRLADFLEAYPPALVDGREPKYVYMETPNGDYYTGYNLDICRHPQSLLVTEMMGAPLSQYHGAPLRLHMPTKYGYKQIKRIGLIRYTKERPDDYWTKLGYDWYAGL
jgi:DMSO/TMAO reductase YedYZ molybdopterin-dependent catalytic subunit